MTVRPLLLGFAVPDDIAADLFRVDPAPAVQTHKFGWSLARSLRLAFGEVRLLSSCPVQSYPLVRRRLFRGFRFEQQGIRGQGIGFINLIVLKHVTRLLALLLITPTLLRRWKIDTVFIHGVHTPYLVYGYVLRRLGLKVIPVLTDPPGVILSTDGFVARALKRLDRAVVSFFLSRSSAIVALAPELIEPYGSRLPTLLFPGILGADWIDQLGRAPGAGPSSGPVSVLYAGGLSAAYGIDRLLDAARALPDIRFVLFGRGDQLPRILSDRSPNVDYGGFLPSAELAPRLLAADILINPRPSGSAIARHSFPSKLLEYLATGRPVLTTRIGSIPPYLAPHFHYIEDESAGGIAQAIDTLAAKPRADRLAAASGGKIAVLEHCSEAAISYRIAAFAASL